MKSDARPVLLSGIQPSGDLLIAHYLGAIRNWVALQGDHDCIFILVDLHTITVPQKPATLRRRCYDLAALYLACGIDPERSLVFVQSHVPAHAELAWILNCNTMMGELQRMTQFKDKAKKGETEANVGLFAYPVLMAADILLYQAARVPVGEDQKQHLELTRDIARRFNARYGETFRLPEPYIPPVGARIMGLQDPTKKMSKSDDNPRNAIALLDPPDVIRSKIRRAVTDSGSEVASAPEKPALSNLLQIYSGFSGEPIEEIEGRYRGKGYEPFKKDLAEIIVESLAPIRTKYEEIRGDEEALDALLSRGAAEARRRAERTLDKVRRKVGFIPAPKAPIP